jgi:hypothetical protein
VIVTDEFLRNVESLIDALERMTHDKFIFQAFAVPHMGNDWKEKYERARVDPTFLGEWEVRMDETRRIHREAREELARIRRGDSPPPQSFPIN